MLQEASGRVMVLGAADVGKSTFCAWLARRLIGARRSVAVLDGDVGQKTVGPPAAVTLGRPEPGEGLRDTTLIGLHFVGGTDPARRFRRVLDGMVRLAGSAATELLIVNTDGFVRGPGGAAKRREIAALAPGLLVGIGEDPGLDAVLRHQAAPVIRLERAPQARRKTAAQRAAARREAFRRYFEASAARQLPARLLAAPPETAQAPAAASGLLCGLQAADGGTLALAILMAYAPEDDSLTVLTPFAGGGIAAIEAGDLRLAPDGSFLGRPPHAIRAPDGR